MLSLQEYQSPTPEAFAELSAEGTPFVMRGLAGDWPLVEAARQSTAAAMDMLRALASPEPADVMLGPPEIGGRFFYGPDLRGFNFARQKAPLADVAGKLVE